MSTALVPFFLADFMQSQAKGYRASIERNLKGRIGKLGSAGEYTGALIAHYSEAMPIWVFLEVVPFGTLLAFYLLCASRRDDCSMRMRLGLWPPSSRMRPRSSCFPVY